MQPVDAPRNRSEDVYFIDTKVLVPTIQTLQFIQRHKLYLIAKLLFNLSLVVPYLDKRLEGITLFS